MIEIPEQLNNLRFIKTKGKIPCEEGWQIDKNYKINDNQFIEYLKENDTYGVLCGFNNLIVIDMDDENVQETILKQNLLPETFTVKTAGKGLLHLYYYSDETKTLRINNKKGDRLLDIQGDGTQVVGAGSTLLNGNKYNVFNNKPISFLKYEKLKSIIQILIPEQSEILSEKEKNENKKSIEKIKTNDPIIRKIKEKIKVSDLLKKYDISLMKNPTDCPMHNSIGGKCLSYTNSAWHCFHCLKGGSVIDLCMIKEDKKLHEAVTFLQKSFGLYTENLYLDKEMKKFYIYKNREETVYKVEFEEFFIILKPEEILSSSKFRVKYFNETGMLLPSLKNKNWEDILNQWVLDKGVFIDLKNEANSDELMKEIIIEEIETFSIINNPSEAINYGRGLYRKDKDPDNIYVCNKVLNEIIKKHNLKISLGNVKVLLDNYIEGKIEIIKCGKKTYRFFRMPKKLLPNLFIEEDIEEKHSPI